MPPAKQLSLDKAKKNKLFYFVANVVVYDEEKKKCLVLKRAKTEKVHPNKWAVPGGKLEWEDLDINNPTRINGDVLDYEEALEELLKRETKEEAGIDIKGPYHYINSVAFIRPDGIPVILLKFAARYAGGTIKLEEGAFTQHAWVTAEELNEEECIKGIPEEIKQTITYYNK